MVVSSIAHAVTWAIRPLAAQARASIRELLAVPSACERVAAVGYFHQRLQSGLAISRFRFEGEDPRPTGIGYHDAVVGDPIARRRGCLLAEFRSRTLNSADAPG